MAVSKIDLSPERAVWRDAVYGEEVRSAGISSLQKTEDVINGTINDVDQAAKDVKSAAGDAAQVAKDAAATVVRANETVDHADQILDQATQQAYASADSAALSQSWASGGTGVRTDEGTNNSEYYSNQSKTYSEQATVAADRAAQYSKIVAPGFYFDPQDSGLYIKAGVGVDFVVVESCLYWKITA